jgi:hypothetical protein
MLIIEDCKANPTSVAVPYHSTTLYIHVYIGSALSCIYEYMYVQMFLTICQVFRTDQVVDPRRGTSLSPTNRARRYTPLADQSVILRLTLCSRTLHATPPACLAREGVACTYGIGRHAARRRAPMPLTVHIL